MTGGTDFFKSLFLLLMIPVGIVIFVAVILPLFILFLLFYLIFAPYKIKGAYQKLRTYSYRTSATGAERRCDPDEDGIDVECTVLESREIEKDQ